MTEDEKTLKEISHANPYTGRAFGDTQAYGRGKSVAADGGSADATEGSKTLSDVGHTSADGLQRSFDRGENQ